MPEEINRIVTDSITDFFYTTSETANKNLQKIGMKEDQIIFVGNTMIDSLLNHEKNFVKPPIWKSLKLEEKKYLVMTLHRPSNVDQRKNLYEIISEIVKNSNGIPIIFPAGKIIGIPLEFLTISEIISYRFFL